MASDDGNSEQQERPVLGYNYGMTDIQAAVGCEHLSALADVARSVSHGSQP